MEMNLRMEKKHFSIVKYKKGNTVEHEVLPSSWVIDSRVYFPKNGLSQLITNVNSRPDQTWLPYQLLQIKRTGYTDYNQALAELEIILNADQSSTDESLNVFSNNYVTRKKRFSGHRQPLCVLDNLPNLNIPPVKTHSKRFNCAPSLN